MLEQVTVGALRFDCVTSGLRHIRFAGTEVLAGLHVVVRDRHWGTLIPQMRVQRKQDAAAPAATGGYTRRWRVRHSDADIRFSWEGLIEAWSAGPGHAELSFIMDGLADCDFLANRAGLCLLHPMSLVGLPAQTRASQTLADGAAGSGEWADGQFPRDIAPYQPFPVFTALRHPLADGAIAEITITGDTFEMEDQRNWTDASFKSYCPPLAAPHPRQFLAGQRVTQRVLLRLSGQPEDGRAMRKASATASVSVRLESRYASWLPAIGLGLAGSGVPVAEADRGLLQALRPGHLHAVIDLDRGDWRSEVSRALSESAALRCTADLEIVAAGPEEIADAAAFVGERAMDADAGRLGRVFVYERESSQTTRDMAAAWAACGGSPSGGSRADFAQLNRADLPAELLSAVAFALSPQVHATDDESIMETITAQPVVGRCARGLAPGHPLVVGPITLKPRFNPVAPSAPPPESADPRQATALTAAWTVGSVAALGYAGAAALTYFETAGPGGVLAGAAPLPAGFPEPGTSYPVFHVLRMLSPLAGRPLLAASAEDPATVAVLAVDAAPSPVVVIANLRPEHVTVAVTAQFSLGEVLLSLPPGPVTGLDAIHAGTAKPRPGDQRTATIELAPWQVVAMGGSSTELMPLLPAPA